MTLTCRKCMGFLAKYISIYVSCAVSHTRTLLNTRAAEAGAVFSLFLSRVKVNSRSSHRSALRSTILFHRPGIEPLRSMIGSVLIIFLLMHKQIHIRGHGRNRVPQPFVNPEHVQIGWCVGACFCVLHTKVMQTSSVNIF